MGWIYPHTGYSLLSLVQTTSGNWCETACGTSLNKVDLGQIRGEVKVNECQIIWVIAVQSKHDENTIRLLLNADDTNWERKIKGSTRRKEQKFKICELFQAIEKMSFYCRRGWKQWQCSFVCLSTPVRNWSSGSKWTFQWQSEETKICKSPTVSSLQWARTEELPTSLLQLKNHT